MSKLEAGTLLNPSVNSYGSDGSGEAGRSGLTATWDELREIATSFAPLGFIAFGGPQAHIALLHAHFVERRGWLSDEAFLELLALGHALPGPTSTQARARMRAGRLARALSPTRRPSSLVFALPRRWSSRSRPRAAGCPARRSASCCGGCPR